MEAVELASMTTEELWKKARGHITLTFTLNQEGQRILKAPMELVAIHHKEQKKLGTEILPSN